MKKYKHFKIATILLILISILGYVPIPLILKAIILGIIIYNLVKILKHLDYEENKKLEAITPIVKKIFTSITVIIAGISIVMNLSSYISMRDTYDKIYKNNWFIKLNSVLVDVDLIKDEIKLELFKDESILDKYSSIEDKLNSNDIPYIYIIQNSKDDIKDKKYTTLLKTWWKNYRRFKSIKVRGEITALAYILSISTIIIRRKNSKYSLGS